jgi:hypothetical protein
LQSPPAVEARQFTVSNRIDVIQNLANKANFGVDLSDVDIPNKNGSLGKFGTIDPTALGGIIAGNNTSTDESGQFEESIRNLDDTVATLRLAEGRVQSYRTAITLCRQTLDQLRSLLNNTDQRLSVIASKWQKPVMMCLSLKPCWLKNNSESMVSINVVIKSCAITFPF